VWVELKKVFKGASQKKTIEIELEKRAIKIKNKKKLEIGRSFSCENNQINCGGTCEESR
jgi:hypothetical protein